MPYSSRTPRPQYGTTKRYQRKRTRKSLASTRSVTLQRSLMNKRVYNFTRWDVNYPDILSKDLATSPGYASAAMVFQLSSVPNYTEFTSLFDQFRIRMVKVQFMFMNQPVSTNNIADQGLFYTLLDFDDNTPPTSESEMIQYQNCRVRRPYGTITRLIRPRYLSQTYETTLAAGYTLGKRSAWIDCQDADTYHFGLKWLWSTAFYKDMVCKVRIKYYLQFKNVR